MTHPLPPHQAAAGAQQLLLLVRRELTEEESEDPHTPGSAAARVSHNVRDPAAAATRAPAAGMERTQSRPRLFGTGVSQAVSASRALAALSSEPAAARLPVQSALRRTHPPAPVAPAAPQTGRPPAAPVVFQFSESVAVQTNCLGPGVQCVCLACTATVPGSHADGARHTDGNGIGTLATTPGAGPNTKPPRSKRKRYCKLNAADAVRILAAFTASNSVAETLAKLQHDQPASKVPSVRTLQRLRRKLEAPAE